MSNSYTSSSELVFAFIALASDHVLAMSTLLSESITVRPAYADDYAALERLAALDSADAAPAAPLLLAEVDGELRAALSLHDGTVIAEPFHPSLGLIELLRTHAAATRPGRGGRRGRQLTRRLHLRTA
jgi:hypothetical protein